MSISIFYLACPILASGSKLFSQNCILGSSSRSHSHLAPWRRGHSGELPPGVSSASVLPVMLLRRGYCVRKSSRANAGSCFFINSSSSVRVCTVITELTDPWRSTFSGKGAVSSETCSTLLSRPSLIRFRRRYMMHIMRDAMYIPKRTTIGTPIGVVQ
jgi:hypothetical protein